MSSPFRSERLAVGTFSDRLYHLNLIHLMATDGPACATGAEDAPDVHVIAPVAPKILR